MDYEDNTPSRNVAPETSPSRHITPSQERSPPDVAHAQEPSRPRHTQTPSSNPYTAVLNQPSRGAAPKSIGLRLCGSCCCPRALVRLRSMTCPGRVYCPQRSAVAISAARFAQGDAEAAPQRRGVMCLVQI